MINLKLMNAHNPHCHFKMEGLQFAKRRLHVLARLKICIFFSSFGKNSGQFFCYRWSGNLYEFLSICLGLGPAPQIFIKLYNITQDKHQNYSLLRRHAIGLSFFRRDTQDLKNSNLPSATSRICHKLEKVCVDASAGKRVFRLDNQRHCFRPFFKQNKNIESSFRMC